MFTIIISEKGGAERREAYDKNEINVGRVQGNDLMLPKGNVSKHHARLLYRDGRFIVTDLKSTNGTYVNGRKIAQATIVREGDKIYIGDFVLRLDTGAGAAAGGPETDAYASADAVPPAPRAPRLEALGAGAASASPRGREAGGGARALDNTEHRGGAHSEGPRAPSARTHDIPAASGKGDPVSHFPLERDPDEGEATGNVLATAAAPKLPPAPRVPSMAPNPNHSPTPGPAQASGARGSTQLMGGASAGGARGRASAVAPARAFAERAAQENAQASVSSVPNDGRTQSRLPPRETAQQAARRLALITLVGRVADVVDLPNVLRSPVVDDATSQQIERTLREQSKAMREEGEAPEGVDVEALVRDAQRELVGLGPLGALLEDDEVTEIHCLRHDHVVVTRGSTLVFAEAPFTSDEALARILARLAAQAGAAWQPGETVLDRRLPRGARLVAVAPPAAAGHAFVLRKKRRIDGTLEELIRGGALSRPMAVFLEHCVAARANVLVCGVSAQSTATFLGALASLAPPGERTAVLHDDEEMALPQAYAVTLAAGDRGPRAEAAVRAAARLHLDRILVGGLAGHAAAAILEVIAEGAEGVLASVYAPSLRQGLARLVAQLTLARPGLALEAARECVGESFDVALELGRSVDGKPRVNRIAELSGSDAKGVVARDVFLLAEAPTGDGIFSATGVVPRFITEFAARGIRVDANLFKRGAAGRS